MTCTPTARSPNSLRSGTTASIGRPPRAKAVPRAPHRAEATVERGLRRPHEHAGFGDGPRATSPPVAGPDGDAAGEVPAVRLVGHPPPGLIDRPVRTDPGLLGQGEHP